MNAKLKFHGIELSVEDADQGKVLAAVFVVSALAAITAVTLAVVTRV